MSGLLDTCPNDVNAAAHYIDGVKTALEYVGKYGTGNMEHFLSGVTEALLLTHLEGPEVAKSASMTVERVWHRMRRRQIEQQG